MTVAQGFAAAMAAAAAAGLAACAAYPEAGFREAAVPQSVDETPFHPQSRYQCGPAALLTLLDHSGVATTMETLVDRVYRFDELPQAKAFVESDAHLGKVVVRM